MPRVTLPPTPASSTEITGEKESQPSSLEMSFLLPPPAILAANGKRNTTNSSQSQSKITSADFSLPPPPTRSRKIIQMKPQPKQADSARSPPTPRPVSKGAAKKGTSGSSAAGKKQPSSTSAAGKKMARKTAHSVIERRRRSKMNEEFGVLKEMIPACKDQDMHKLAILQVNFKTCDGWSKASLTRTRRASTTSVILSNVSPIFKLQTYRWQIHPPSLRRYPHSKHQSPRSTMSTKTATATMTRERKTRTKKWQTRNPWLQHPLSLLWNPTPVPIRALGQPAHLQL